MRPIIIPAFHSYFPTSIHPPFSHSNEAESDDEDRSFDRFTTHELNIPYFKK